MKKFKSICILSAMACLTACENADWSFPDYDYTTVYFAYQSPVRTLVLGNDEVFDNTLDNEHKCLIKATMGGVYDNGVNRIIMQAPFKTPLPHFFNETTGINPTVHI